MTAHQRAIKGAAGFPGFAWPKTTLLPGTERGLTSEFGMGSGGTRALWPANPKIDHKSLLINFSVKVPKDYERIKRGE